MITKISLRQIISSMLMWLQCVSLQWHNWQGDITQQSHDIGWDDKHARVLTLLSNNITVRGRGRSTHKRSNLGFRTDSFREMFFLEAGWKYRLREEERGGKRGWGGRKGVKIKQVRKAVVMSASGDSVNPLWVLPGDIRGDCGSHILHYGLNPVATDSRGHGWQGAGSLFTLKAERHLVQMTDMDETTCW